MRSSDKNWLRCEMIHRGLANFLNFCKLPKGKNENKLSLWFGEGMG